MDDHNMLDAVSRYDDPPEVIEHPRRLEDDILAVGAEVRRVTRDPDATIVHILVDGPGRGRVAVRYTLARRAGESVTWRWATLLTDGSPVGGTGAMLYSGDYESDPISDDALWAALVSRGATM